MNLTLVLDTNPPADALPLITQIVRLDTAAIVASNVPMVASPTTAGRFTYTLTTAVAGVSYKFTATFVSDGIPGTITKTQAAATEAIAAYNTLTTARATALGLGLTRVTAASDAALTAVLLRAAMQIDSAMRYQGRKYDTLQEREFPRIEGQGSLVQSTQGADTPTIPVPVLTAEVFQADYLLASPNSQRQQAIADGVSSQSVGGQSESYRPDAKAELLCVEARLLLVRFRLRSGALL